MADTDLSVDEKLCFERHFEAAMSWFDALQDHRGHELAALTFYTVLTCELTLLPHPRSRSIAPRKSPHQRPNTGKLLGVKVVGFLVRRSALKSQHALEPPPLDLNAPLRLSRRHRRQIPTGTTFVSHISFPVS